MNANFITEHAAFLNMHHSDTEGGIVGENDQWRAIFGAKNEPKQNLKSIINSGIRAVLIYVCV